MKAGKEYEEFIYEKFKSFFVGFNVTANDRILGKQSNIKREIDVSVRGKINDIDLLYIVQCKDHSKPADVKIIGEFSAVIKDLGASKGFLVCTSGFAKTIHEYAKNLGIDLITIEDIKSSKWKVEIEIPIIYIKINLKVNISLQMKVTDELVEKNKNDLTITLKDMEEVSVDSGRSTLKILDYINIFLEENKIDIIETKNFNINNPNLLLYFVQIWVPIKTVELYFNTNKKYYLKYVRPEEYSQLRNHVTKEILPLQFKISGNHLEFNDTYLEIDKDNIPITSTILCEIEEDLYPIKHENFEFPGFKYEHIKN